MMSPTSLAQAGLAWQDSYFVDHYLFLNVDFYTGCIYSAIGLPNSMFTVMFTIPRTAGAGWPSGGS